MLVNSGIAKLLNVFESFVIGFFCKSLYISMQIAPKLSYEENVKIMPCVKLVPVTKAVVVDIAGVIFPASPLFDVKHARYTFQQIAFDICQYAPRGMKISFWNLIISSP